MDAGGAAEGEDEGAEGSDGVRRRLRMSRNSRAGTWHSGCSYTAFVRVSLFTCCTAPKSPRQ